MLLPFVFSIVKPADTLVDTSKNSLYVAKHMGGYTDTSSEFVSIRCQHGPNTVSTTLINAM